MLVRGMDLKKNNLVPGVLLMGHRQNNIAPDVRSKKRASYAEIFCLLRAISKLKKEIIFTNVPRNERSH